MHLTGFMIYCPAPHMIMSWVYPREKIRHQWTEIEYWVEIAQTLERGKFDLFFFADGWGGGTNEASVRYAIQFPNSDPLCLVPYLAALTTQMHRDAEQAQQCGGQLGVDLLAGDGEDRG